jgi:hypothetical protein
MTCHAHQHYDLPEHYDLPIQYDLPGQHYNKLTLDCIPAILSDLAWA